MSDEIPIGPNRCVARVQSKRRTLRNYYSAISMGLGNGRDADLGRRALDDMIRDNEAAITEEEKPENDQAHRPAPETLVGSSETGQNTESSDRQAGRGFGAAPLFGDTSNFGKIPLHKMYVCHPPFESI